MAIVDNKTPRLGLLLPNADNFLQDDVERLIQSLNLLDVLVVMRDKTTGKIADDQLSDVIARLTNGKLAASALPASVVQTGADGKIDASLMPSIAVVDTFPVPNEASMLGLKCERGDIAIRTDLGETYILTQMPPSTLSNWRVLTTTSVSSVNGKTGAVTGLAASGENNDITAFKKKVNFQLGASGADASDDSDYMTKKQVTDITKKLGSGGYVGEEFLHPTRSFFPNGCIAGDGQVINGASALYPDLVNLVKTGMLPNTTEATWQSSPLVRASYVYNSTADTLRVPDLNGTQPGSIPASVMRGDGGGLAAGSIQKSAVPNVKFSFGGVESGTTPGAVNPFGAEDLSRWRADGMAEYVLGSSQRITGVSGATGNFNLRLSVDAGKTQPVYNDSVTEARMNSIVGCYVIRAATEAQNSGSVDVLTLQAQVEALRSAAVATDSKIGYALLAGGTTDVIGTSQRIVLVNPFGVNTPVVCLVEVKINNVWCTPGFIFNPSVGGLGASAYYREGEGIVVQGGSYKVAATAPSGGSSGGSASAEVGSAIYRVHVWSIGKDISKLKQISQIDPALIQEFKAPVKPTGIRQVWTKNGTETGLAGTYLTFNETLFGKLLYLRVSVSPNLVFQLNIPGGIIPQLGTQAAGFTGWSAQMFVSTAEWNYSFLVSPDGKQLYLHSTTSGASAVDTVFVDDYSVQP